MLMIGNCAEEKKEGERRAGNGKQEKVKEDRKSRERKLLANNSLIFYSKSVRFNSCLFSSPSKSVTSSFPFSITHFLSPIFHHWLMNLFSLPPSLLYQFFPSFFNSFHRQYQWIDEKGKRAKFPAPQYIDYALTFTQKTVNDESIFPTKFGKYTNISFPSTFPSIFSLSHFFTFPCHSISLSPISLFLRVFQCSLDFIPFPFPYVSLLLTSRLLSTFDLFHPALLPFFPMSLPRERERERENNPNSIADLPNIHQQYFLFSHSTYSSLIKPKRWKKRWKKRESGSLIPLLFSSAIFSYDSNPRLNSSSSRSLLIQSVSLCICHVFQSIAISLLRRPMEAKKSFPSMSTVGRERERKRERGRER